MSSFLREVNEQGRALRAAVEAYRDQEAPLLREAARIAGSRPIVFAGMGSSWAAALAAEALLVRAGRLAFAVDAAEVLYRWLPVLNGQRSAAPVLISQSGESKEVVQIAARISSPYVAVTNSPGSALGRRAGVVLPMHAGEEKGVTSKTFLNTIAVTALFARTILVQRTEEGLSEIARLLEVAEFLEAAVAIDQLLARSGDLVREGHGILTAPEERGGEPGWGEAGGKGPLIPWEIIGRGSGLAAVEQGALTLRELTGRVLVPFRGGLYRHGPVYRCGPFTRALILAARDEEGDLLERLAGEILERGGRVVLISDFPPEIESPRLARISLPTVARGLFPILAMIPLELLGIADAEARGFDPAAGVPKVTPVE